MPSDLEMFFEYIRERKGHEVIRTKNGFGTFTIDGEYLYLVEIFVSKEARLKREGSAIADVACEIAKSRGCKYLLGSVSPHSPVATESMKAILAYGMRLHKVTPELIFFVKEV